MNSDGRAFTFKLCGSVDPSVKQPKLFSASVQGITFELRMVYIADDDLGFINHCTHHWDEFNCNMHREPYHSVAMSNSGQTFIISMNDEPVCVVEVHHALQYYTGEEFMPKEKDYFVRIFFSEPLSVEEHTALLHFLAEYCSHFNEVDRLVIKPENPDDAALANAGFDAHADASGNKTGVYFYSTSKENV